MSKKRQLPTWMRNSSQRTPLESNHGDNSQSMVAGNKKSMDLVMLPELNFTGKLVYSYNLAECSLLCEDILSAVGEELVVGMDMEWPVTYTAGAAAKTAVIQLCTASDTCFIFHLSAMSSTGFPKPLRNLICDQRVKKVGVNIEGDIWKLARDFDDFPARSLMKESVVELSTLANSVLNSAERWSLDGLTRHLLDKRLFKEAAVRCGSWNVYPLTEQQKCYASTDALASLLVYQELQRRCSTSS